MPRLKLMLHLLSLGGCCLTATGTSAQLAEPNAAGVAMGHLHYVVSDVEAETEFWVGLGGTASEFFRGQVVHFPNVLILISEGEPEGGTEGSVINHVAFRVRSLAEIEARGYAMEYNEQYPGIASVYTPSGERIELFDDALATNIGFAVDPGIVDAVAERHNRKLTAPIVSHHMHFNLPEDEVDAARTWYVETFGATPGKRWRYTAADLPGMNLNFSAAPSPVAPTKGRRLDHIGFEIQGLEAFCAALAQKGVELDTPYRKLASGFAFAYMTDPWGTRIELTEGLRAY